MIVHIGYDVCVESREVVAVLDYKNALASPQTLAFIEQAQAAARYTPCAYGTRSLVLLNAPPGTQIIESALATATLKARLTGQGLQEEA